MSRDAQEPSFNVQADRAGEKERKLATSPALLLEWVLHTNHEGKQGLLLRLPANHWSLRGSDWGTEGLVRWCLVGLPRPELDHLDLSDVAGTDPCTSAVPMWRPQGRR